MPITESAQGEQARAAETASHPMLIGRSPAAEEAKTFAHFAGKSSFQKHTTLLLGENGTGKGLLARLIHWVGGPLRPFVVVNCPSLPESLVESEMFGHTKGAFTGSQFLKPGYVEEAKGGTLFLDEIAGMSLATQAKLLRFVETKRFRMIGENKEHSVDTRIIAATNIDPEKAIKDGRLLEDLFHRLDRLSFTMPPLREHREDIGPLVLHILEKEELSVKLLPETLSTLSDYHWPGNVRELENVLIKSALAFFLNPQDTEGIGLEHIKPHLKRFSTAESDDLRSQSSEIERRKAEFRRALVKARGNISRATRLIGIKRSTGYNRIERWDLGEFVKVLKES